MEKAYIIKLRKQLNIKTRQYLIDLLRHRIFDEGFILKKISIIIVVFIFFNFKTFAQEDCNNGIDDDGDGQIDCQDSDCTGNPPSSLYFNTANNGSGSVLSGGDFDLSWEVSDSYAGPYSPAIVMRSIPSVYYSSPWPNSDWISFSETGYHSIANGDVDYYFKIEFLLPCFDSCGRNYSDTGTFCLSLDFFADNSVHEIWVNNSKQEISGIPVSDPYYNAGFSSSGKLTTLLCQDWQPGVNEIIIRVSSGPEYLGLLVQSSINSKPLPYANISGSAEICQNDPSPTINFTGVGAPPFIFTYSVNNVVHQTLTAVNGNTASLTAPTNITGKYTYTLVSVKDANAMTFFKGCAISDTVTITVYEKIVPIFDPVSAICSGDTLSALPTTSNNGISGKWSPIVNNLSTTSYTFTPLSGQCPSESDLTITVKEKITPTFSLVPEICSGATLSALPTSSNNGIIGTWSPVINNLATTTYTFTPSPSQCASETDLTITVKEEITPTFSLVPEICSGATLSALPTSSNNGIIGTWSPVINNLATTTYTFTPSPSQCANTTQFTINVVNDNLTLYVPNAFTPNGDGLNDIFTPVSSGISNYRMKVFNRWGQFIFETDDLHIGWDGWHKGRLMANGVYLWIINYSTICSGNRYLEKLGTVTLIK